MRRVELGDLVVEAGGILAVVGRAGSGKSMLARSLVEQGAVLIGPGADAATLAEVVAAGPSLIVADEPGRDRDPGTQHDLLAALHLASRDRGITTLIFTADLRLPIAMGLETAILADGRFVERGPIDSLTLRPEHEATRRLVAAGRPRSRTMARPPIGDTLLAFDRVTMHRPGRRGWPFRRERAVPLLSGVSVALRSGQAIGLLGPAGAGKSQLLRLAAGVVQPDAGRVVAAGRARIAMLFSDPHAAFNPRLPVGLTLTEPLRLEAELLVDEQAERLVEAVRVVGLSPGLLDRRPAGFSPLELQRLALARAILGRPGLILLDEPTAGLDPVAAAEFVQLFNRVRSDYGLAVLWASRDFALLRQLCDRIAVLDRGELVEMGTPGALFETGAHPTTRSLVAPRYPEPPPPMPPSPPEPEHREVAAPVPSADDGADERAEGRQLEPVAGRSRDGAGSMDAADRDGQGDDHRALRHVEGA